MDSSVHTAFQLDMHFKAAPPFDLAARMPRPDPRTSGIVFVRIASSRSASSGLPGFASVMYLAATSVVARTSRPTNLLTHWTYLAFSKAFKDTVSVTDSRETPLT